MLTIKGKKKKKDLHLLLGILDLPYTFCTDSSNRFSHPYAVATNC